jgi:putative copper export protein
VPGVPTDVIAGLTPALTTVRLSLHVFAATIWVGGQLTVAGLLPTARNLGEGAPRAIARAFARIQWPAYFVLIATGIWNISDEHHATSAWSTVLGAKIAIVAVAGIAAIAHTRSKTKTGLATYGALTTIASLVALVLGIVLAG